MDQADGVHRPGQTAPDQAWPGLAIRVEVVHVWGLEPEQDNEIFMRALQLPPVMPLWLRLKRGCWDARETEREGEREKENEREKN